MQESLILVMSKLFSPSSPRWPRYSPHCLGSTKRIPLWEAEKAHFPCFASMWVKPLCIQIPCHWEGSQVIGRRHEILVFELNKLYLYSFYYITYRIN